jgi:hypothetical protein
MESASEKVEGANISEHVEILRNPLFYFSKTGGNFDGEQI